ncbi:putative duf636 domain protein [Lasiodiplodia theobromae]|uniref:Glutathione-dependent formaldehyde-activating enzyme n=2 Tax=Lasiodiplodia TaxID=66739 RepID=A0AA40D976_9PEZI|nr:Glutathione-dependent formaldehyde-activating enzyme [Lasiodiplodia theobromae]KAB2574579.1 putative glutathione-dependent formaldehyde-activating enzyme [Lasiodiplodia theobromae]KAF4537917.1 Glutathione-dependent formaldehyde-activating enzyme [Lasiodiplodia theobromae]KAF9635565.1 putative duf636 domain protein [Lasiodiplodia theobromae]KAK0664886.1 putative glutathione-dependent formaldehyde-activating enzyme [Lasiodiplodia hormozganensis]
MTTYHGHCACGQTKWEVTLEADQASHILCHCDTCKYLSGSAFTLNQIVPKSALKFTAGGDNLKAYTYTGESGKPVHCYYCPNCTTHPYHHQTALGDDKIILRTGLLDESKSFKPAAEIFGKAKLAWEKEVAQTFETLPPQ